jgi:predicted nucleotidyltransferase
LSSRANLRKSLRARLPNAIDQAGARSPDSLPLGDSAVERLTVTRAPEIELPEPVIVEICRRHQSAGAIHVWLAAQGEMRPPATSIFVLISCPEPGPGRRGLAAMMRELTTLLDRRVDIAVKPGLKPLIRPGVLAEARLVYAACSATLDGQTGHPGLDRALIPTRQLSVTPELERWICLTWLPPASKRDSY